MINLPTADELLAFCNKVREAGGANILEALLPSNPGDEQTCLIARALNFECQVLPARDWGFNIEPWESGCPKWLMVIPGLGDELVTQIAEKLGLEVYGDSEFGSSIVLPEAIGRAAEAFDDGSAYQEFVERHDS